MQLSRWGRNLGVTAGAVVLALSVTPGAVQAAPGDLVGVCHRTDDADRPYEFIRVANDSVEYASHLLHRQQPLDGGERDQIDGLENQRVRSAEDCPGEARDATRDGAWDDDWNRNRDGDRDRDRDRDGDRGKHGNWWKHFPGLPSPWEDDEVWHYHGKSKKPCRKQHRYFHHKHKHRFVYKKKRKDDRRVKVRFAEKNTL
ncbi:hypothetical protein LO762_00965 [Actinocorallia sp. API 0066]|uniref:hypothetical protein n=1 Tax=Actinocorallia sp. API 0066 TaxID=2896846 RepID=UPI001E4E9DBD|nr:hypothetical protein [Actinocorallia sp. API 0066]MCD0447771.1 hypothetical protein [Actinocorallia sp. API 0066]